LTDDRRVCSVGWDKLVLISQLTLCLCLLYICLGLLLCTGQLRDTIGLTFRVWIGLQVSDHVRQ